MVETQLQSSASITFSDPKAEVFARDLFATLESAGVDARDPELKAPEDALLGTAEVLLTLFIASASRAVLLAALDPLQKYLENKIAERNSTRVQIILIGHEDLPKRFPLSLRGTTTDVLHTFIAKLRIALESI